MNIHPMWKTYPELAKELNTTLKLMENSVNLKNKEVENAVMSMIHSRQTITTSIPTFIFTIWRE